MAGWIDAAPSEEGPPASTLNTSGENEWKSRTIRTVKKKASKNSLSKGPSGT
jgi:hypothetical protein